MDRAGGGVDRLNERGPLFQRCRLTLGLSVGEVARAAGVRAQDVRGWESRRQRIPARAWRVLLTFMDAAARRTMDRSLVSYYGTLEAKRGRVAIRGRRRDSDLRNVFPGAVRPGSDLFPLPVQSSHDRRGPLCLCW